MSDDRNKPLRLVLKVGGHTSTGNSSPASGVAEEQSAERKRKHHKKKKKKEKRRRKEIEQEEADVNSDVEEATSPVASAETGSKISELDGEEKVDERGGGVGSCTLSSRASRHSNDSEASNLRSLRGRKTGDDPTALQQLLEYLQRILQRKDVNSFFALPVTDQIAPKYSEIIKEPMDFSTMKTKIDDNDYKSVIEYKNDFRIMMQNCLTYNHPDTIFYKEGERLLNFGLKQLNREKLLSLKRNLAFLADITDTEMGLDVDDNVAIVEYKRQRDDQMYEAFSDDLSPEDLVAQVRQAAEDAARKIKRKNPNGKVGFLRCGKDGTTTFNFLNPDNNGILGEKEKVVCLGDVTGKLKDGACNLAGFREDKRNKVNPVSYLGYGPYTSYAPTYDSSSSNLSKEESDSLITTYGSELGISYAHSMRSFVDNTNSYCVEMVDKLLDLLTHNQHGKTVKVLEKIGKENEEQESVSADQTETESAGQAEAESVKTPGPKTDIFSPISDVSQSETDANEGETVTSVDVLQQQLDKSAELLGQLRETQHQRLSQPVPVDISQVAKPSQEERKLAEELSRRLLELAQKARPADIVSSPALRQAMGVGSLLPVKEEPITSPQPLPGHRGVEPISPPTPPAGRDIKREEQWNTIQEVLEGQGDISLNPTYFHSTKPALAETQDSKPFLLPSMVENESYHGNGSQSNQDSAETEAAISQILR